VDLSDADLSDADLTAAYLGGADLQGADLHGAEMNDADLRAANISNAELRGANLYGADLRGAQLRGAKLIELNLGDAALEGADLSDAVIGRSIFPDIDLSTVQGLDTVRHSGPSTIGIDTVYRSQGEIPEVFLRGAGVPDNFITYMRSLACNPFDFYSCFLSYSTKDEAFAKRLHESLRAHGVRCWFAPHDIQGGRKVHEQIDEAIKVFDKLLLILTDASMNSNWVKTEIANARAKEERQKRQMLFPITLVPYDRIRAWKLFDADTGIDSAREIREYFVPDFSNWKDHDSYQQAFDRLMRDLQADPRSKGAATTE
jgi:hypothetical protein